MMVNAGIDYSLHDTYYVVAHWHFVAQVVAVFGVFIVAYGLMARHRARYRYWLGVTHYVATLGGVLTIFAPQLILGARGMPRRYVDQPDAFELWNAVSSAGNVVTLASFGAFAALLGDLAIRVWMTRRAARRTGPAA